MMQTADLGYGNDGPERRRLNAPRDRCIPLQGEMWTRDVVVVDILTQDAPQVPFAEDDQVVQAFATDRPDDPLGVGALPMRLGHREELPDTDRPDDPPELVAVGAIPIRQQVARLSAPSAKGLPDLLGGPRGGRMGGDVEVNDAPAIVGENHEAEEKPEGGGGNDEEIAGGRGAKVIPKPRLKRPDGIVSRDNRAGVEARCPRARL